MEAQEAIRMLKQVIKGCPRIREPENFVAHAEQLSSTCVDTVQAIKNHFPEFRIDEEEIRLAGILHDIGHAFSEIDEHHPVIGGEYLLERGMERIAKTIQSHTFMSEILEIEPYKNYKPEDLLPKTWNEVIITYASMRCGKPGEQIEIDEKFRRFENKSSLFRKAVALGKERIYELYDDIEALKEGKDRLSKYSFL